MTDEQISEESRFRDLEWIKWTQLFVRKKVARFLQTGDGEKGGMPAVHCGGGARLSLISSYRHCGCLA